MKVRVRRIDPLRLGRFPSVAVVRQHVRKLDADAASSSVCHAPSVVHPLKWEDVCPWRSFLNLAGGYGRRSDAPQRRTTTATVAAVPRLLALGDGFRAGRRAHPGRSRRAHLSRVVPPLDATRTGARAPVLVCQRSLAATCSSGARSTRSECCRTPFPTLLRSRGSSRSPLAGRSGRRSRCPDRAR
jgi:hypothetical protein